MVFHDSLYSARVKGVIWAWNRVFLPFVIVDDEGFGGCYWIVYAALLEICIARVVV